MQLNHVNCVKVSLVDFQILKALGIKINQKLKKKNSDYDADDFVPVTPGNTEENDHPRDSSGPAT